MIWFLWTLRFITPVWHRVPRSCSWKPGLQGCPEPRAQVSLCWWMWQDTNVCVHSKPHLSQGRAPCVDGAGLGYTNEVFPRGARGHTGHWQLRKSLTFAASSTFLGPFVMSSTKLHLSSQLWGTKLALGSSSLSHRSRPGEQSQGRFFLITRVGRDDTHFVLPGKTFSFQQGSLHKVGFGFVLC